MSRSFLIAPLAVFLLLACSPGCHAADPAPARLRVARTCDLGAGSRVSLLAEPSIDGSRFYLRMSGANGATEPAFSDMPGADFVGSIAMSACVGPALIFAVSYGPPYLKGVVLRRNPATQAKERIDFAEKSLPLRLYLGPQQMRLVIPNAGNEVPSKYLVYDFFSGKGQGGEPSSADELPDQRGFTVLDVARSRALPR